MRSRIRAETLLGKCCSDQEWKQNKDFQNSPESELILQTADETRTRNDLTDLMEVDRRWV